MMFEEVVLFPVLVGVWKTRKSKAHVCLDVAMFGGFMRLEFPGIS